MIVQTCTHFIVSSPSKSQVDNPLSTAGPASCALHRGEREKIAIHRKTRPLFCFRNIVPNPTTISTTPPKTEIETSKNYRLNS